MVKGATLAVPAARTSPVIVGAVAKAIPPLPVTFAASAVATPVPSVGVPVRRLYGIDPELSVPTLVSEDVTTPAASAVPVSPPAGAPDRSAKLPSWL
jgi:hypothetical protein